MQFSSRYDEQRLPARSSFSLARCFKALVDWFDYAYAVVPAAGAWMRNPTLRLRGRHAPAVIHLRGPFAAQAVHVPIGSSGEASRAGRQRTLAKAGLFAGVLMAVYLAFALTSGGPSRASAPSSDSRALVSELGASSVGGDALLASNSTIAEADAATTVATPVRTLQSALVAATEPPAAASEKPTEAPRPAPVVVAAALPAAQATPESRPVAAPVATPAPSIANVASTNSGIFTSAEIRAFATTAGWDSAHLNAVVQVAWCESTNNSAAIGGAGAYGLMQLLPFWFRVAGVDFEKWSDPVVNLRVALVVYQTRIAERMDPWSAWDCTPTGN